MRGHQLTVVHTAGDALILVYAIIFGFLAGWGRAMVGQRNFGGVNLQKIWLVFAAVFPQFLAFQIHPFRALIPDWLAASTLILSMMVLLLFVWFNRDQPGFWALGLGLGMNMLVILFNNGWMPISPATASHLVPDLSSTTWEIGQRFGFSKDIVLPIQDTRLWLLSDIFLLPNWSPIQVAYSAGDMLIAMGTIWLLWAMGGPHSLIYQEAL